MIFDMCVHLIDKEKALEAEAADLAAKQARAREFVELYSASMLAWAGWAVGLQRAVVDMVLHTSKQLAAEQAAVGADGRHSATT